MEVTAIHRHARVSPRKVRLVLDAVKGQRVDDAIATLHFMPSPSARLVEKVVKSAVSNAENNYSLPPAALYVKRAFADDSRRLKRSRPRARGRAGAILRRTSHITVVVEEKES